MRIFPHFGLRAPLTLGSGLSPSFLSWKNKVSKDEKNPGGHIRQGSELTVDQQQRNVFRKFLQSAFCSLRDRTRITSPAKKETVIRPEKTHAIPMLSGAPGPNPTSAIISATLVLGEK